MNKVLRTPDLFRAVVSYQNGLHPDIVVPVKALRRVHLKRGYSQLQMLQTCLEPWLRRHGVSKLTLFPFSLHRHLFYYALLHGNVNILAFLDSMNRPKLDSSDWDLVVTASHANVLHFFLERNYLRDWDLVMQSAIQAGSLAMIECLCDHGVVPSKDAFNEACVNGHAEVAQFLREKGFDEWDPSTLMFALVHGHLDVVRFLFEHGYDGFDAIAIFGFEVTPLDIAAKCGHLEIVQYIHRQHGQNCSGRAFIEAAKSGHLAIVQFLDGRILGSVAEAAAQAVANGHFDVVVYLCETHSDSINLDRLKDVASNRRHSHVLAYLQQLQTNLS
ncbi:hypothetical protein ACHHYP_14793 [Achlya hypogyna]|uniref:Uncharacterized protein n=1 Tax=Achlya hypogyna TaxID=1202772 RepID=A0A1V9YCA7_ACHHY|nr:hypothetical protein ACHHYP_14793 [Achlya hypogyna]